MTPSLTQFVRDRTGLSPVDHDPIQSLWGGTGTLFRIHLADGSPLIAKHIQGNTGQHPRGWNTDRSHARKQRSYEVEQAWYQTHATTCSTDCRIPRHLASTSTDHETIILLEDLDAAGFPDRLTATPPFATEACVRWLAYFHATFLDTTPDNLWPTGTYWHLDTRPDELAAMPDGTLKEAASAIDRALSACPIQTLVHGDAKLANFCFSPDHRHAAAVDFQYVGGGCGMKDLTYFLGSALTEPELSEQEEYWIDRYFNHLATALDNPARSTDIESAWRPLYPLAAADFHRFLLGWSPGHWKLTPRSDNHVQRALASLSP